MFTVYLSLDVGDPGEGEHQRHGVAEAAGVERDPDVARHQQVVLMRQKVIQVGLHTEVVAEVHQAVAGDDEDGGDGSVEQGGPVQHGDVPAEGDLWQVTKRLGHHQHYQGSQDVGADVEGKEPDQVKSWVDLGHCLCVLQAVAGLQQERHAGEQNEREIRNKKIFESLQWKQFEGGNAKLIVHSQG